MSDFNCSSNSVDDLKALCIENELRRLTVSLTGIGSMGLRALYTGLNSSSAFGEERSWIEDTFTGVDENITITALSAISLFPPYENCTYNSQTGSVVC